MPVIGVDSQ